MKYCQNSNMCPWGNAMKPGTCGYDADMNDTNECPMIFHEADYVMDRLIAGTQVKISQG